MNRQVLRVVWYRFRATFGRRWGQDLALVLLIGLVGGIAMGSIAAARRTQSAYPRFLANTNPTDLTLSTYGISADSAANRYSPNVTKEIARLAQVRRVESWVGPFSAPLGPDGAPNFAATTQLNMAGSLDGLYFNEDRATPIEGRMASPDRADEFVTTATGARLLGLHVGQAVSMGFYSGAQASLPGFGTARVPPQRRIDMRLVGLVVFNNEVAADETDRLPTNILFTPTLTRSLLDTTGTQGTWYGLQLVHGSRDVAAVEQAIVALLPPGSASFFRVTSLGEAKVERAVKPEAIAIGVFGAIAAFATVLIAIQAIARQLRSEDEELQVLRTLGAGPAATISDGLIGILAAVVFGTLLAGAIAVTLSPLAPLGPVRPVYPSRGVAFDWTVLGIGLVVLIGGLGAIAWLHAYVGAPHRVARRSRAIAARRSSIVRMATSSGLSAPAVVGAHFALEPGGGRTAVPVRSALVGTALAVVMVVATLTFGSGLRTLVSHPALYGWNWSYALNSITAVPPQATALLDHDPKVAAWAGVNNLNVQIDGLNVPALFGGAHAALAPPLLSGHAVAGKDQIVVGAATLVQLHKHVGDTVVVSYGTPNEAPLNIPPTRLVIVGTATMPAIATSATLADHTSMGVGALLTTAMAPPAFLQAVTNPDPILSGPGLVFVRLRKGVSTAAGRADMQRIADAGTKALSADPGAVGTSVQLLGVQHPAEIVNYRSAGATPALLASGLAAGATLALGLTLAASVRRRRHDLALMKTLGFTKRQIAAAVAWQASITAIIGVVVGVPVGVALGRQLWILFARNINAVPQPTVPAMPVVLVALGALVLANLVATLPRRSAARTPAAHVLRTG